MKTLQRKDPVPGNDWGGVWTGSVLIFLLACSLSPQGGLAKCCLYLKSSSVCLMLWYSTEGLSIAILRSPFLCHSSDSRFDPDSYPFFHLFLRIFGNAIALLTLCNYWMRLPCHSHVNWVADSCYSVWNLAIVYLRIDGMMLCSHLLYLGCYRMRSLGSTPPSEQAKEPFL